MFEKMDTKIKFNPQHISRLRLVVQVLSFAAIFYGGYLLAAAGLGPERAKDASSIKAVYKQPAALDVYLPATSCIYQKEGLCHGCSLYLVTDTIVWKKSPAEWLVPVAVTLVLLLAGGRLWCGWVCPLGFLSDLLTRLRQSAKIPRLRLSRRLRDGLVWAKYIILAATLVTASLAAWDYFADERLSLADPFCQVCPQRIFAAFFSFDQVCWTNFHDTITTVTTWLGLLAFGLFFLGLAVRRFWCRLCPIGALSAPFNRTGLVMLRKDDSRCTRCRACERVCPLDVRKVYEARQSGAVTAYECHLCLRCLEVCPEKDCLQFRWFGARVCSSGKNFD